MEQRLAQEMDLRFPSPPKREEEYDEGIDQIYKGIVIEGRTFSASEILFAVDDALYRQLGADLCDAPEYDENKEQSA